MITSPPGKATPTPANPDAAGTPPPIDLGALIADGTVDDLTRKLVDLEEAQLTEIRSLEEKRSDPRSTALSAIDAEIKRRADAPKDPQEPQPDKVEADAADADKADADKASEASERAAEADQLARNDGFIDAAAKTAAEAAAKKKSGRSKAATPATPKPAKAIETVSGEDLRKIVEAGEEKAIQFGDESGPNDLFAPEAIGLAPLRGRLATDDTVAMRTAKLPGTTSVTHAWLLVDGKPVAAVELAAPIEVAPNEQLAFKAGQLAFD